MVHPNELDNQLENLRTLQQSYDQIAGAAEAYNMGKVQLATAITSKGVETSPTESYPEMAKKVNAIAQETYEINGGEMYAKQLFGSLTTPNYWNLYEVLAQLLSDGRLVNYGGILLAEYYKGYDSLVLSGAGSGGAYVVSDKDENGQFKMYTNDTTHTWDDNENGKIDRFVAYCFADVSHDFEITNTDTSPRAIFIGRKVGTIESLTNGRCSEIVVPDGNKLKTILSGIYTQNFGKRLVLRNIEQLGINAIVINSNTEQVYISCDRIEPQSDGLVVISQNGNQSIIIKASERIDCGLNDKRIIGYGANVNIGSICIYSPYIRGQIFAFGNNTTIYSVSIISEELIPGSYGTAYNTFNPQKVYFGYITNDKTKSIKLTGYYNDDLTSTHVELQDGWCKPANLVKFTSLTKESVQTYIFDRLGVNDLSTGTVTITLASAVLSLFTQEEIDAVVERTNITIVGV